MSEYDLDNPLWFTAGKAIMVLLMVSVLLYFLSPFIMNYFNMINTRELHDDDYQLIADKTEKVLSDPNVTCEQIQNMRQLHVQVTESWQDPLYRNYNFDTARDLWNAKNCGNHWGWFES